MRPHGHPHPLQHQTMAGGSGLGNRLDEAPASASSCAALTGAGKRPGPPPAAGSPCRRKDAAALPSLPSKLDPPLRLGAP